MSKWAAYMRAYRRRHSGARCRRCSSAELLPGGSACARCVAQDAERKHPDKRHDLEHHARLVTLARNPLAKCEGSGLTLAELARAGYTLQVDRINPSLGYVPGNCQVIACYLNAVKRRELAWPWWAVEELRERVAGRADWGDDIYEIMAKAPPSPL